MSIKVMTAVWDHSKAAGTDLLVLLALADMANDDGECWPAIGTIARKCRIDARTTQRRIRSLEQLGEVVVVPFGGKASIAGGTRSNRYRIVVYLEARAADRQGGESPGNGTDATPSLAPVPPPSLAPVPPEPSVEPSKNRQKARSSRRHPLPIDFELTAERIAIARDSRNMSRSEFRAVFEKFCAYHRAEGTTKADWDEAWRSWCLRERPSEAVLAARARTG